MRWQAVMDETPRGRGPAPAPSRPVGNFADTFADTLTAERRVFLMPHPVILTLAEWCARAPGVSEKHAQKHWETGTPPRLAEFRDNPSRGA